MENETRYQKSTRVKREMARHTAIVSQFVKPIEEEFEIALQETHPPCHKAGLPSRWVDWSSDPELRESYEGDRLPSAAEAEVMCADCPITGEDGLCSRYAKATGQSHGVWGGLRVEKGRWLKDNE